MATRQPNGPQCCPGSVQDSQRFEDFVAAQLPALLRFGHLLTGEAAAAEDLVQTALTRLAVQWPKLREPAAAGAYVRRSMVRLQTDRWHRVLSRERVVADVPERAAAVDAPGDSDERDAMWSALARLPARQRAVLVLRFYEHLTPPQVAEVMGTSLGTVKSQTSKGLARLREVLTSDQIEVAR